MNETDFQQIVSKLWYSRGYGNAAFDIPGQWSSSVAFEGF